MYNLNHFPDYFRAYLWEGKHHLFGYPPDSYPSFYWIVSIEQRFDWLKNNYSTRKTASRYLIQEMIQWGGSQNGTLQKFDDAIGEVNLFDLIHNVINNLDHPDKAIESALKIPGMGLTYASKLLRFLDPETYGALDSRLRRGLTEIIPKIQDSQKNSMINGYENFIQTLSEIKNQLDNENIIRPACNMPSGKKPSEWRAADIEMALFQWASTTQLPEKK